MSEDPFIDEPVCDCGHTLDEHEDSFLAPCAVEDCDCVTWCEATWL